MALGQPFNLRWIPEHEANPQDQEWIARMEEETSTSRWLPHPNNCSLHPSVPTLDLRLIPQEQQEEYNQDQEFKFKAWASLTNLAGSTEMVPQTLRLILLPSIQR